MKSEKTILIVDDDDGVRDCLGNILSRFKYSILKAESAERALNLLKNGATADLAIIDYQMPGMDGIELLRALRHLVRDLPVVVLTGNGTLESYCQASALDVTRYVLKPIGARDLAQLVAEILGQTGRTTEGAQFFEPEVLLKQLPKR